MAQNRGVLYGYQIKNGKIELHEDESKIVRIIYHYYGLGKSYKTIAELLTAKEVRYMPEKPIWNKNMVARILQNANYIGNEKYPSIITSALSQKSALAKKSYSNTLPSELKDIKHLFVCGVCGAKLARRSEKTGRKRWYCPNDINHISLKLSDDDMVSKVLDMQNILSSFEIKSPQKSSTISFEVIKLQNEINRLHETTTENMAAIQKKIMELSSLTYQLCDDTTHIEKHLISQLRKSTGNINPKLLGKLVQQIHIIQTDVTGFTLKNGFTITKE